MQRIEAEHVVAIVPRPLPNDDRDNEFYPQFQKAVREAARQMAQHYEIFYCLENSIRDLVSDQLSALHGDGWWVDTVPETVKENVVGSVIREKDAAVSSRSPEPIDYTTFGELSVIIDSNWESFSDIFNSRKGVTSVLARLNLLRGPIAHCSELSEDEVVRLRLSLADWFRLQQ
jgi:hypothetical protein